MNPFTSQLYIVIGPDLDTVTSAFEPISLSHRQDRPSTVTIVTRGRDQNGFRSNIASLFPSPGKTTFIDATAPLPRLLADLRIGRLRRVPVDIDRIAPRLRQVRLPRQIAAAEFLVSAIDLRGDPRFRPDVCLGLWANLVSPVHRMGARLSGPREGLTAELLLARPPDLHIAVDELSRGGPVALLVGSDPVAIEVLALSLRQLRSPERRDTPGPWEDPLVQQATELELGAPGPTSIQLTAKPLPGGNHAVIERVEAAASRAGISRVAWARF